MRYYEILQFFSSCANGAYSHITITNDAHSQNLGIARMPNPLFWGRFSVKRAEIFFALRAKDTTRYYEIL